MKKIISAITTLLLCLGVTPVGFAKNITPTNKTPAKNVKPASKTHKLAVHTTSNKNHLASPSSSHQLSSKLHADNAITGPSAFRKVALASDHSTEPTETESETRFQTNTVLHGTLNQKTSTTYGNNPQNIQQSHNTQNSYRENGSASYQRAQQILNQPNLGFHYGPDTAGQPQTNVYSTSATRATQQSNLYATPTTQIENKNQQIVPAPQVSQQSATAQDTGFHWFRSAQPDTENNQAVPTTQSSWFSNIQSRAALFAHNTVSNLHYTSYRFGGTHFDPQNGIYMLDCSGYVDDLLHQSSPQAYTSLAQWTGSYKPNSEHYYNFFNRLAMSGGHAGSWSAVPTPETLQPGDVLVFRYKNPHGRLGGGHVMLVMNKSVVNSSVVEVQVADSASAGHSADTRAPRTSGVGIGTLLLKVNPMTGRPYAYAWKLDSPWNSNVNIAMGHPANA